MSERQDGIGLETSEIPTAQNNHLWNEHFQTVSSVGTVMVRIHQENLQLYFEDVKYVDRFLWWDIRLVRMALQINSNMAFSSALVSALSTWYLFRKSDTCPHSDEGTTRKHPASVYNEETSHCFIHDWILKNHWSEGRLDSQTDYGHIRLEACPGPNIYKHIFSQGKKKNMPSNPPAKMDVSF